MSTDVAYRAAICAQLVSLKARHDALTAYVYNTAFQLEANITLRQIEALEKAMKEIGEG